MVASVKTRIDTVISFELYPRIKFVCWSSDHECASKYVDQKDEVWRGHPGIPLVDVVQKSASLEQELQCLMDEYEKSNHH